MTLLRHLIRFAVAAIALMFIGFIVPGFAIEGFWNAFLLALVIAILGWTGELIFGENISPYNRGVIGFITSAAVIYLAKFFIPGVKVTILGAVLSALLIGLIDLFVPIKANFVGKNNKD